MIVMWKSKPSKQETPYQYRSNTDPESETLDQHWSSTNQRIELAGHARYIELRRQWPNKCKKTTLSIHIGSKLGQCHRQSESITWSDWMFCAMASDNSTAWLTKKGDVSMVSFTEFDVALELVIIAYYCINTLKVIKFVWELSRQFHWQPNWLKWCTMYHQRKLIWNWTVCTIS